MPACTHACPNQQAKAQSELAKQRAASADAEKQAFELDAKLNEQLAAWRGKKNIVEILNTLGDIVPNCVAPAGASSNSNKVPDRPSPAELRKARKKIFLRLHPDKIPKDASVAEQLLAKKVFALVNDVYNKLPDHMK